jgi:hypothetical protein
MAATPAGHQPFISDALIDMSGSLRRNVEKRNDLDKFYHPKHPQLVFRNLEWKDR